MNSISIQEQTKNLDCANCGAQVKYKPGTINLVCEYCNTKNEIKQEQTIIQELNYNEYIQKLESENLELEKIIQCKSCGSISYVDEKLKSLFCAYCHTPILDNDIRDERYIKPGYLLPFKLDKNKVSDILSKWIDGLWWAPDNLKKAVLSPLGLRGIYIPYWTFDLDIYSEYTGERGLYHATTINLGKNKIPMIEISWEDTTGSISLKFDDVLCPASGNIDADSLKQLFPWDLDAVVEMNDNYLAGFITEKYKVTLKEGFQNIKEIVDNKIKEKIKKQIGGDSQRISTLKTEVSKITFKHILLPVFVSTYQYNNRFFHFYVNGRNGKLIGERPYSNLKIILAVIAVILLLAIIVIL